MIRDADVAGGERIALNRVFLQRRAPGPVLPAPGGHLHPHVGRIRQQDLVLDDLDLLQPVLAPLVADPFRQHAIARRPGDVRCRGQVGVRLARAAAGGQRQEAALNRSLLGG